ncbi:MAG: hypothetical protein HY826_09060 [Actinobacteria bacterium]|nr:hypothetical protein [Actinomycetota bacterium]
MSVTRLKFAVIGLCAAVGLAACGDDGTDYSSNDGAGNDAATTTDYGRGEAATTTVEYAGDYPVPVTASAASDTSVADSAGGFDVALADSDLGQILVDGAGNTLYLFTSDSAGTVTCTGGCAGAWPGLAADDELTVGDGLDDSMFSTVAGDSGPQLAFNGHPLYHFSGDSAAGDTNGQGSGGVWFVVGADGNAITG